jgi:cytidine deaminase
VAIFKAVSAGEHEIKAVAVFAESPNSQLATRDSSLASLTPPCGACLQVISEFAENPEIVLSNGRTTKTYHLKELLPLGFRL